jgi:transcriptional/translational regulatory protein YebC/TACO1
VICAPDDLQAVRAALEEAGIEVESAELTMLPKTTIQIEDEAAARKLLRLMDALDENDDVQDVYANFDMPEGILQAVA